MIPNLMVYSTMTIALIMDIIYGVIPNWLTISSILLAIIYKIVGNTGFSDIEASLLGIIIGGGIFIIPFILGGMGGGDIKLMASIGAWFGPKSIINIAIYISLCGFFVAIIFALINKKKFNLKTIWEDIVIVWLIKHRPPGRKNRTSFPYTTCIFIGTSIYTFLGGIIQ